MTLARPLRNPYPPLVEKLRHGLPEYFEKDGRFKAREFAVAMDCTTSNIYSGVIGKGSISVTMMRKVIGLPGCGLTEQDLLPFVTQL